MRNIVLRHTSQFGAGADYAPNDCGAACLVSLGKRQNPRFNFTVDQVFMFAGVSRKATLGILKLRDLAGRIGLRMQHSNRLTFKGIMAEIDAGSPVLMLVFTGCFSQRPYRYAVGHYLVITGYDLEQEVFYIMDPLSVEHDTVSFLDMAAAIGVEDKTSPKVVAQPGLV